jgi:hypothetical protein
MVDKKKGAGKEKKVLKLISLYLFNYLQFCHF